MLYLIGIPRSGKSTLSKLWQSKHITFLYDKRGLRNEFKYITSFDFESSITLQTKNEFSQCFDFPRIVLSGDALRLALHGQIYCKESEGLIGSYMEIMTRMFLDQGYDVLIDETSTSKESLTRYYRVDKKAIGIFVDTNVELCKQRAEDLRQEYLLPVIERINKQYLCLKENFQTVVEDILRYLNNHV